MAKFRFNAKDFGKDFNKHITKEIAVDIEKGVVRWKKDGAELLKEEIKSSVARGVSPLKGGGNQTGGQARFKNYSPSYTQAIKDGRYSKNGKTIRPINLKLSGKMMKSMKHVSTKTGFTLWFASKLAKYHNDLGAGKSKVIRKLLPTETGEEFSRVIYNNLVKKLDDLIILD